MLAEAGGIPANLQRGVVWPRPFRTSGGLHPHPALPLKGEVETSRPRATSFRRLSIPLTLTLPPKGGGNNRVASPESPRREAMHRDYGGAGMRVFERLSTVNASITRPSRPFVVQVARVPSTSTST